MTPLEIEMDKFGFVYDNAKDAFINAPGHWAKINSSKDVVIGFTNSMTKEIFLFEKFIGTH